MAGLVQVLAAHRVNYHQRNVGGETSSTLRYTSCEGCDWLGRWHDESGWEAHLAAAILAHLRAVAADEGVRERVADDLLESDAMTGNDEGTPFIYYVEPENVDYLAGCVTGYFLNHLDPARPSVGGGDE